MQNCFQWWIHDFHDWVPTPKVYVLAYYFAIFFTENCKKMKEFEPRGRGRGGGGCVPGTLLEPHRFKHNENQTL